MTEKSLTNLLKERDQQLLEAKSRILELEDKLSSLDVLYVFSESEKMMLKIIEAEIKRISVGIDSVKMTRDEIKLFDTLVKDFVALRGKVQVSKSKDEKETEENIDNLISIVNS